MAAPNVIIVMTDDQGYGDLGCTGNPWISTPHIDAFSREAVRCNDFHVSPLCTPSRGALMTGRYPLRNGAWATAWGRSILRRDETTMADVFRAAGYRTGLFGKWHLGDTYPYRPQDRGFDKVVAHKGGGVGQTPDHWGNNYFDDTYFHNGEPREHEGYCTDVWFDEARDFVTDCGDDPFFAVIATNAPHSPYIVDSKYSAQYRGNPDIPEPEFYGMITNIDENFGALDRFLKGRGLAENTLLIFMTDNGSSAGAELDADDFVTRGFNAGMRGLKGSYYDGGHRVPFFMRCASLGLTDRDVTPLTAHIDLLPTLMSLLGLGSVLSDELDGQDVSPLLRGEIEDWPDRPIFLQNAQGAEPPSQWDCAVMSGKWRLIGGAELYDISIDPEQRCNVAADYPNIVQALRLAQAAHWSQVAPELARPCAHLIGHDAENPTRLDAMDLMGDIAWDQPHVMEGLRATGSWHVEIDRAATYRFRLQRWPEELDLPIAAVPPSPDDPIINKRHGASGDIVSLNPNRASLQIGATSIDIDVAPDAHFAEAIVQLEPGECPLTANFTTPDGEQFGAYYVYCERLS
ncbi:MAG: arylsulfatase [Yoonia sp.]|uniref:arylsulfatase n=1 Tax=Yoonia sp. TaxID=2212373 RepID=UPI003EFACC54